MSAALVRFTFHGDALDVVLRDGTVYVSIRRVCETLGIAFQPQIAKLREDPGATITMIVTVAGDGKNREIAFIPLRALPLWLATIHPSKVKVAIRPKLLAYRVEAAEVLADHFLGKRALGGAALSLSSGVRTTVEQIDPARAADLLTHRNPKNRRLRPAAVRRYAADMKAGRWILTHQGIGLGPDGEIIDGQHRLSTVVATGLTIPMTVTVYEDAAAAQGAKLKVDSGLMRPVADRLVLGGVLDPANAQHVAATAAAWALLESGSTAGFGDDQAQVVYAKHQAALHWSMAVFPGNAWTAPIRAAFAFAWSTAREKVEEFAELVKEAAAPRGTPAQTWAKAERDGLLSPGGGAVRRQVMLRALRILAAHVREEKGLSRLYTTDEGYEFFRKRATRAGKGGGA